MIANELFTWCDDYSVNIEAIDEQHKALIELINQLHLAIVEHRGTATAREVLERLTEYAQTHFRLEEHLMKLTHYPEFDAHRQQHQVMIDQIQAWQHKLNDEHQPIAFELLYFLKKWLTRHIAQDDRRFGAHFVKAARQHRPTVVAEAPAATPNKTWWSR